MPWERVLDAGTEPRFVVPVGTATGWRVLQFRGRAPHTVRFGATGLTIEVVASAGPIVYPLPEPMRVGIMRARGSIRGRLAVPADRQGQPGFDDFALRLGLVEVGTRRPSWFERRFAPAWLRTLFDLAPPGRGISSLRFFNLAVSPEHTGRTRRHPASDLIVETTVGAPEPDGRFQVVVAPEVAIDTAAIWIAADGDDTRSTFMVVLESLELDGGLP